MTTITTRRQGRVSLTRLALAVLTFGLSFPIYGVRIRRVETTTITGP